MKRLMSLALAITFATSVVAQTAAPTTATAPANKPVYTLKQETPDVGSNIRREVMSNSLVPLDKTYADLTPAERANWNNQYINLGAKDEPPFPARGLRDMYSLVVKGQERLRVKGKVSMVVTVDEKGQATDVSVLTSPNADMSEIVARVMMAEKFKPALCDGKPCKMEFPFRTEFLNW
jgi:Gram-negative bacterial TonB protein C-terminal